MSTIAATTRRTRTRAPESDHPIVRVAVYVRRSLDKGLAEQTFTSLDAQEEAVRAYITSQRTHGWTALGEAYVDRGATGSNTDREALQRLCDDVRRGRVDVVATYRLDRLSRSQRDFFELMHFFDEHGVSFVSVTEQFNTTTPMGRFALSISAAVAQLERETIAARTRDKIHATRRRGQWTGGAPPLGYNVIDKRLVINEQEAKRVRRMFERYLEVGSLMELANELNARGELTKSWTTKIGRLMPSREWTKSRLQALMRNPLYVGRVRLGDETFDGEHDAIVSQELWGAVQRKLTAQSPNSGKPRAKSTALLAGLLICARCGVKHGSPLRKPREPTLGQLRVSAHRARGRGGVPRIPGPRRRVGSVRRRSHSGRRTGPGGHRRDGGGRPGSFAPPGSRSCVTNSRRPSAACAS